MVDMQVSVCIVNWNTREHLRACLASLQQHGLGLNMDVLVVDNASSDGSADMVREQYSWVRLYAEDENLGYAAGNNIALREATGQYLLLLNPDITVTPGAIGTLLRFLESHPQAGAVAPKLVHPDGSLQLTCRSFPDPDVIIYEALGLSRLFPCSRSFGKYRMSWWDYADMRTVDQPMASALLLRRDALDEIGLMDESFPIFFNDVDLCRRLWDAGWEVWFTPEASMVHEGGASTRQVRRQMIRESHLSLLRYYRKHYRGRLCPVVYGVVVSTIWLGMQARIATSALAGRR
jgi:GT2 family glycosyltransferase